MALLALQAMTPNALAENFQTTRQAVSKHLRVLTECELVKQPPHSWEIYYSLQAKRLQEIDHWLSQYKKLWEARFTQLDSVLASLKQQNP